MQDFSGGNQTLRSMEASRELFLLQAHLTYQPGRAQRGFSVLARLMTADKLKTGRTTSG
jgi:hypothetical protein